MRQGMMDYRKRTLLSGLAIAAAVLLTGCGTGVAKPDGVRATYLDPAGGTGMVAGTGVESQDLGTMSAVMISGILSIPRVVALSRPPRLAFLAGDFVNESSQRLNKTLVVERLRVGLLKAAQGRVVLVNRAAMERVMAERDLKRDGVTDVGQTPLARATFGVDYFLRGRMADQRLRNSEGAVRRYTAFYFTLVDAETGEDIWGDTFEVAKESLDDVAYQ